MKKIILSAIMAAAALTAGAQTRTAYFMEGTTFRSQFNPAFAPTQGYVNIPVLGGIGLNVDGTLSLNDILKKNPNGPGLVTILSSSIPYATAVEGLNKRNNSFNFNTNVNIIGFGAYTKNHKNFWSVDVNLHAEAGVDIPFSFFDFAKNVSSGDNAYDFSRMKVVANSYVDVGFNYSLPVTDKLYVGARAKFLVGLAHANARLNSFNLNLDENRWSGNAQAEMNVFMNGFEAGRKINDAEVNFKGPAGYGFAVDLGASYEVIDNLHLSLAVNDIGFISWSRSSAAQYATDEEGFDFSGMDVVIDKNGTTTNGSSLSLNDLNMHTVSAGRHGASTALRATVNAGVEYEMWDHWVGFGLLYHARMGLYKSSHNLTASVNFHPRYWFTLSPSYTFNNNSGGAVGLALNFSPSFINFFVATDMLLSKHSRQFIPIKQDRMTFTFGLGVPVGRRGYRVEEYRKIFEQKTAQKGAKTQKTQKTQKKSPSPRAKYGTKRSSVVTVSSKSVTVTSK